MNQADVEIELLLDEILYGNSFHKIVDGKKVRIDPHDVWSDVKRLPFNQ